jgi:uncharacterized membrane protein
VTVYLVIAEPPFDVGGLKLTVACALPAEAFTVSGGPGTEGAGLPTSMPVRVSVAVLPATSVHVPVAPWFGPGVVSVFVTTVATGPEPASAQLHFRVTGFALTPLPSGSGVCPR